MKRLFTWDQEDLRRIFRVTWTHCIPGRKPDQCLTDDELKKAMDQAQVLMIQTIKKIREDMEANEKLKRDLKNPIR